MGDALYGFTVDGGAAGFGTIYKLDPKSGAESIVHSFDESDGEVPFSELVAVGKHIYGTTERGGPAGNGAVFEITA